MIRYKEISYSSCALIRLTASPKHTPHIFLWVALRFWKRVFVSGSVSEPSRTIGETNASNKFKFTPNGSKQEDSPVRVGPFHLKHCSVAMGRSVLHVVAQTLFRVFCEMLNLTRRIGYLNCWKNCVTLVGMLFCFLKLVPATVTQRVKVVMS